jgi:alkylation response protein AidB-like acyl-CoA dehydrogenase
VYFSGVAVPIDRLIGGRDNGWTVASTHLDLEHGMMATVAKDEFLESLVKLYVKNDGQDFIADDADVLDNLAEVYIDSALNRLLALRNFWMQSQDIPMTYEGSQAMYLKKKAGLRLTRTLLEVLGPLALTSEEMHGALDTHAEEQQREGIVNMHPGGTGEIHKLIIARRLGLGVPNQT